MANKNNQNSPIRPLLDISFGSDIKTEIESLLECPVCFEFSLPPIYNCKTGHTICNRCRPKIKVCPICQEEYSGCRNFLAEKLSLQQTAKCNYNAEGCTEMVYGCNDLHLKTCEYRNISCFHPACVNGQSIKISKYMEHLYKQHQVFMAIDGSNPTKWDLFITDNNRLFTNGTKTPYGIYSIKYDKEFLHCMQVQNNMVWIWIALAGTESQCSRYQVNIIFKTNSGNIDLRWKGPCHAIRTSSYEVRDSGFCLVTTVAVLRNFLEIQDGQKVLHVRVSVMSLAQCAKPGA